MSSFFGHSLAGLTTYAIGYKLQSDRMNRPSRFDRSNWLWLGFLVAIALIPDIDYLVPKLKLQQGFRRSVFRSNDYSRDSRQADR